jgi:photosystem II stability/assembly factor-like uncharacterized protein
MIKRNVISLALLFFLTISFSSVAQWTTLQGPPGANVVDFERTTGGQLLVVTNGNLYGSSNNGDSWAQIVPTSPTNLNLDDILVTGTTIYGLNYSQFYKSTDGGLTWTKKSTDGAFYGVQRILRFGPDNFLAIYGWNGIFVSKDEGVTWTKIYSKEVYYSLVANSAGDLFTTRYVEKASPTNDENQIIKYAYPGAAGTYAEANWTPVYIWNTFDGYYLYYMSVFVSSTNKVFATVYDNVISSPSGNLGTWVTTKAGIADAYFYESSWTQSASGDISLFNRNNNSLWRTSNQGTSWTSVVNPAINYGSSITRVVFGSGSTIFASSNADGVFRSDDNGATWTLKSNGLFFGQGREIEISSTNRIIYLNNNSSKGYWTSTDNGATWTFVPQTKYFSKILKLADGKILLYGADNALYRSDDNGATFTDVESNYFYSIVEDGSGNLIGSVYNAILKSTDKGTTWVAYAPAITGLPANANARYMAIDNTNARLFFWFEYYDGSNWQYKLYRAPVAGGAATEITEDPWADDSNLNISNVFITNGKLYVTEYNAFYESSDFGATWKTIGFSGDRVFPITGGLCVSKAGSLYVTQDGGLSWNSTSLPIANSYIYDITPISGGFMAAASNSPALKFTGTLIVPPSELPPFIDFNWQPMDGPYGGQIDKVFSDNSSNTYAFAYNKFYKTTTFSSWAPLPISANNYVTHLTFDKTANTFYGLTYNKVVKSTDSGVTWTDVNTENISCRTNLTRAANNDFIFNTECSPQKIYVSTDGGATFGAAKYTLADNENIQSIITSATSAIFVTTYDYTLSIRKYYRSTDRGTTWAELATMPAANMERFIADQAGNIYTFQSLNPLFKSTDNGATWTNISGNLSANNGYFTASTAFTAPSGELWLAGWQNSSYGFFKTANGGTNWTFVPLNSSGSYITSVTSVGTRVVASTSNGVYTSDDNGATFVERSTGIINHSISEVEVVSPTKLIALTNNNKAFESTNSQTFTPQAATVANKFYKNPDGSLYAYNSNGVYKTLDNGNTWTKFSSYPGSLEYLATANGSLYFGAGNNEIRYTLDFATWNVLTVSGLPTQYYVYSMAVNGLGAVFLVVYNYDTSKQEMYQILFGSAIKFDKATDPRNVFYDYEAEVIRLYDGQGVIYQTSDGSIWTSRSAPAGDRMIVAAKGYYFIPIYGGVLWLSRNQGQTWQSVGLSTFNSNTSFQDVTINEFNGLAYGALTNSVVRKSANIVLPSETTPPIVTALSPLNNSTGVSVKPQLTLTFDEAVTPVAAKTIKIIDAGNPLNVIETIVVTTGTQNGKTFTFNTTTLLQNNKAYFVVMDHGAFKDIFNNDVVGWPTSQTTWKFTTKAAPTVVSTTPANAATGVSLTPVLTATFSEPMLPVAGKTLKVYKTTDVNTPVATITLQAISNEFVTFVPAGANSDQGVKVRFDARKGQGNLIGASQVYMMAGVVTTNTPTPTNGNLTRIKGGPADNTIGAMTKVAGETDVWEITLGTSLRNYFDVPTNETIYHVGMVFRNGTASLQATPPATIPNGVVSGNVAFLPVSSSATPACQVAPLQGGNSLTFTVCTALTYSTQYFVKFDASSFTTVDGGPLSAFTANTDWTFTTIPAPDNTAPTIAYTAANFTKGAANKITVTVTDNAGGSGVDPATVKIMYRGITIADAPVTAAMTSPAANSSFEITVLDAWLDELGLEFTFEAKDVNGNTATMPANGVYKSYIIYPESTPATISSTVLSFGGEARDYRIISIPHQLANANAESVFNEFDLTDKTSARLLTYNGTSYIEAPTGITNITRGVGYWFNARTQETIAIEGATTPSNSKESPFSLTLKPGWNQIGNPYPFPISWDAVKTAANNVNIGVLKTFNGESYSTDAKLNVFEGGFVFLSGSTQISVPIPMTARTTAGRVGREEPDFGDGWLLPLHLDNGNFKNPLGGVGMHQDADLGFDPFDDVPLPAFFDMPEMKFPHAEHSMKDFVRDIVPINSQFTWSFTVNPASESAILSWDPAFLQGKASEMYLFDESEQRMVDMLAESQYVLHSNKITNFKIYYGIGQDDIKPSRISLGKPFPNPVVNVSKVNFTLPERNALLYKVSLEVFDVMGRKVQTLAKGEFESGFYEVQWIPGENEITSASVYVYKLTVHQQSDNIVLTQKVIINK